MTYENLELTQTLKISRAVPVSILEFTFTYTTMYVMNWRKKNPQKSQNAVVHDKDWPQWSWRRGPHHPESSGPRMHAAAFSDHTSCSEILHSSVGQENIRPSAFHNFSIVKWPHSGLVMLRYVTECTEWDYFATQNWADQERKKTL